MSRLSPVRLAVAGLTAFALALPSAAVASPGCPAVDVIVARGSTEPANGYSPLALDGIDGSADKNADSGVWTMIRRELTAPTDDSTPIPAGDVVRSDVVYPADLPIPGNLDEFIALNSTLFRTSQTTGLTWVINHLNAACSSTRFVLLGFSQGALIMNNIASPVNKRIWVTDGAVLPTLNPGVTDRIAAISVFSDAGRSINDNNTAIRSGNPISSTAPAYLAGMTDDLNRGQNDGPAVVKNGFTPRDPAALAGFKGRIRSYCLTDDVVCSTAGGNFIPHILYGDPTKKERRRNLAIFAIQKLRNEADKTLRAQCTFQSATNSAVLSQAMSLTIRFQASVNDRSPNNSTNQTTNIRATLQLNGNEASLLNVALGSPTGISRSMLFLPMEASDGWVTPKQSIFMAFNDTVIPHSSGSGFAVGVPGGTGGAPKTASWNLAIPVHNELTLKNSFDVLFYGAPTGSVSMKCNFNGLADSNFGGRHFGRVVVE